MPEQGIADCVMRKGARNKKVSPEEKERNKVISRTRCRIEHVFGFLKRHKRKFDIQTMSLEMATANITLKNIVYNLHQTIKLLENKTSVVKLALMY